MNAGKRMYYVAAAAFWSAAVGLSAQQGAFSQRSGYGSGAQYNQYEDPSSYSQNDGGQVYNDYYDEQQGVYLQQAAPVRQTPPPPERRMANPQDTSGGVVFAPYVSGLRADAMGSAVVLTWQDAPSITGPVFIYRSRQPFYGGTTSNQYDVREAPYGTQSYTENVPSNGTWYYLAVASDEKGQRFEMVVPFRNMVELFIDGGARSALATSWTVPQTTPQVYSQAQAAVGQPNPAAFRSQALAYGNGGMGDSLPFVEMGQSAVTGLTTTVQGQDVHIQFLTANTGKNAVLYRALTPIVKFGDLLVATVVKLSVQSPYVDRVTPGVPYYYAVVYEEDLMNGQATLSPGNNTTLVPVEGVRSAQSGASPYPALGGGRYEPAIPPPSGTTLGFQVIPGQNVTGGLSTVRAPGAVMPSQSPSASTFGGHMPLIMEARVFNEDLQKSREGTDEYELSQIVQRYLMWRNWNEGRGALMKFLSSRKRSAAVEARTHFYLGECAYFLGLYREALSEFVAVQSVFPSEAATWVQSCLTKISGK